MSAPTDRQRWQRLSELFERALELDATARHGFIDALAGTDVGLRDELRAMLDADAAAAMLDEDVRGLVADPLSGPPPPHEVGSTLGAWQLDGVIGEGGMGVVYAAHRIDDFDQQAAIKCLQHRWDGRTGAARFLRERSILASLTHPNIARLLDGGIDGHGQPWFAMERIDGQRIDAAADAARLDLRQRIRLLLPVCNAVQHAHERLVVHRDLKPDNILVDGDGHPKVLDFGVAKLLDADADDPGATRTGLAAAFTPEYAAPEQIHGGEITTATDVHALGLVLYRLLTGRMPFELEGRSLPERIAAIGTQAPMRPEQALATGDPDAVRQRLHDRNTDPAAFRRFVGGDLTRILQTALAKEPQRRYATVQAFATDLQRFLDGRPVSVSGDTAGYRFRKFVQRNPLSTAFAGLLLVLVAGFGVFASVTAKRIADHAEQVVAERDRAQAIADFLGKLLTQADPTRASGDLTADEILDRGIALVDADASLGNGERIGVLTAIGGVRQVRGEYEDAHAVLQRAVELGRAGVQQDLSLPNALLELSKTETRLGRHAEAEAHAREALAALDAMSAGAEDRASALNQLALALSDLDRNPEAAELLQEVVRLRSGMDEAVAGRNLAANYNNLGLIYTELGRLDEAATAYDASLAIVEREFGDDHPYVAFLLGSRAELHEQRGNPPAARAMLEQALEIARRHLGEEHPFVADVLYRLGRIAAAAGEHEVAREHLERALRLQRQALPDDHPDIAQTLAAIASLEVPPAAP